MCWYVIVVNAVIVGGDGIGVIALVGDSVCMCFVVHTEVRSWFSPSTL